MWSVESKVVFAVSALTFAAIAVPAEAKIIQYEINDQVYSYNSRSRAEIEAARMRINAANRVDELREQARAERESNFLVRLFGSPLQKAAAQAESDLKQIVATPATTEVRQRIVYGPAPALAGSSRDTAKVLNGSRTSVATSERKKRRVAVARIISTPTHITVESMQSRGGSGVRSVTIDVNSGTQTTTMRNGSMHQHAVDRNLYGEDPELSSFVDQVRGRSDPIQARIRW